MYRFFPSMFVVVLNIFLSMDKWFVVLYIEENNQGKLIDMQAICRKMQMHRNLLMDVFSIL